MDAGMLFVRKHLRYSHRITRTNRFGTLDLVDAVVLTKKKK